LNNIILSLKGHRLSTPSCQKKSVAKISSQLSRRETYAAEEKNIVMMTTISTNFHISQSSQTFSLVERVCGESQGKGFSRVAAIDLIN